MVSLFKKLQALFLKREHITNDLAIPDYRIKGIFLTDNEYCEKLSAKLDVRIETKQKTFIKTTQEFLKKSLIEIKKYLPTNTEVFKLFKCLDPKNS